MYIITFYSFKGGVGRTMALLNVAGELVRKGRKVLVVDFDLEAPGVDTYSLPQPRLPGPGLVDYITAYLRSGAAPSFTDYCYECPGVAQGTGRLWIMPSGKQQDSTYAADLAAIDWQDLYANRDGYLLFQNLKADWASSINPDYVLIDSRTGHTDVTGICTRQLPDAVAVFFHPDEQNRRGLASIIQQIRKEALSPRLKQIRLYFVMSNVPDLDDEDEILAHSMEQSKESLGYRELTGVIHRYNSLALLNQVIFTLERPRSRLAAEYRNLVEAFVRDNLDDREGALTFLAGLSKPARTFREGKASEVEHKLSKIRTAHAEDAEVLMRLAQFRRGQRKSAEALALLDAAERCGAPPLDVCLARADLFQQMGDRQNSIEYATKVLDFDSVDYIELTQVINILRTTRVLETLSLSPAVRGLEPEDRVELVEELRSNRAELKISERILTEALHDPSTTKEAAEGIKAELLLVLVGLGEFERALEFGAQAQGSSDDALRNAFNFAMAKWGATESPDIDLFKTFLGARQESSGRDRNNPNYLQCLALAEGVVGRTSEALAFIEAARKFNGSSRQPRFSAWVYLDVPADQFARHLDEQEMMTRSNDIRPPVIYSQGRNLFVQ